MSTSCEGNFEAALHLRKAILLSPSAQSKVYCLRDKLGNLHLIEKTTMESIILKKQLLENK